MAQTTSVSQESTVARVRSRAWVAHLPWEAIALLAVCAVAVALRWWPLNGSSVDTQDEGVYWQSLRAMAAGQPLFSAVFSSQPPLFLLSLYPFYTAFGHTILAARLGLAVYSLVGLLALYAAGRIVGGRWAGLWACVLLAADPLYLRESHVLNAEIPSLACSALGVAFAAGAMRARAGWPRLLALLAGVAIGAGIMIKLFAVAAMVPAVLYVLTPLVAPLAPGTTRRVRARVKRIGLVLLDLVLLLAGAAGVCAAVLLPFRPVWPTMYDQVVTFHQLAEHTIWNLGWLYNLQWIDTIERVYPVYVLAAFGLILAVWRRAWSMAPLLLWLAVTFGLLIHQQPFFGHHAVMLSPPLALISGLAFAFALRRRGHVPSLARTRGVERRSAAAGAVLALVAFMVFSGVRSELDDNAGYARPPDPVDREMARALQRATRPHDWIITDDQYVAGLANRTVVPQLVDTSSVRIATAYLKDQQGSHSGISTALLKTLSARYHVRVILAATDRFSKGLGRDFTWWVNNDYHPVARFDDKRVTNTPTLYLYGAPQPAHNPTAPSPR